MSVRERGIDISGTTKQESGDDADALSRDYGVINTKYS